MKRLKVELKIRSLKLDELKHKWLQRDLQALTMIGYYIRPVEYELKNLWALHYEHPDGKLENGFTYREKHLFDHDRKILGL